MQVPVGARTMYYLLTVGNYCGSARMLNACHFHERKILVCFILKLYFTTWDYDSLSKYSTPSRCSSRQSVSDDTT